MGSSLWNRLPTPPLPHGHAPCHCEPRAEGAALRLIVVTGGPGAGKTAVLAAARASFCEHVSVIPEAATILFGGGFPRHTTVAGRAAAQRAIFHVQHEAERLVDDERSAHTALCDRGTVDGAAYWPDEAGDFWGPLGTSRRRQIARYAGVIHLRVPEGPGEYNHSNPMRVEDLALARNIDERILAAWADHPNRVVIESEERFEDKLQAALATIREWIAPSLS